MFITMQEKNIAKYVSLWVKHQLHFLCKVFIYMQVVLVKINAVLFEEEAGYCRIVENGYLG